ncbi:hypothetical protein TWF192_005763 [Orbilia oligospora]|nr:hypothetical protein TWF192_005763 [Orbilia oligospora]
MIMDQFKSLSLSGSFRAVSVEILHLSEGMLYSDTSHTLLTYTGNGNNGIIPYGIRGLVFPGHLSYQARTIIGICSALRECILTTESMDICLHIPHSSILPDIENAIQNNDTAPRSNLDFQTRLCLQKLTDIVAICKQLGIEIYIQTRDLASRTTAKVYNNIVGTMANI